MNWFASQPSLHADFLILKQCFKNENITVFFDSIFVFVFRLRYGLQSKTGKETISQALAYCSIFSNSRHLF